MPRKVKKPEAPAKPVGPVKLSDVPDTRVASVGSDPGILLKRLLVLHEDAINSLEYGARPFLAKGDMPAKFTGDLINLSKSMDSLTMSYARYRKSEDDWANSLNPEQKLAGLYQWVLKVYRDQPELVAGWAKRLVLALNEANDATKVLAQNIKAEMEADEPGGEAWMRKNFGADRDLRAVAAEVRAAKEAKTPSETSER